MNGSMNVEALNRLIEGVGVETVRVTATHVDVCLYEDYVLSFELADCPINFGILKTE